MKPNLSKLARDYNVSRESLRSWRDEGVDLSNPGAIAERVAKMPGRDPDAPSEGESYSAARTRRMRADADRAELTTKIQSGELINRAEVEDTFSQLGAELKGRLLSMRGDLVNELAGRSEADVFRVLDLRFRELLEGIHTNSKIKP